MSRVRSSVDRASVSGTEGRGFESLRAHQQRFHTIGMEPFFVVYLRFEGVIRDAPDIYLRFEGVTRTLRNIYLHFKGLRHRGIRGI